MFSVRSNGKVS